MKSYKAAEAAVKANSHCNDMQILTQGDTISLLDRFGLIIQKDYPQIGKAETLSMLVYVPGSGRPLDLSRSLDGKLHYIKRTITTQFVCVRPRNLWDQQQQELEKLLHGQWIWFRFRNNTQFWRGHLTVQAQPGEYSRTVTIKAVCNPYSYNLTAYLGNDWLWDTFNFEEDTIYTARTEVKRL